MAGDILCVGTDGTGAPMRRREVRGRKGKNGGRARTREVKVGTVFTHRKPDQPDQRPERDYASTTYLAAILTADQFGPLLRAEAIRRGMAKAKVVVFLGDGAVWVWKLWFRSTWEHYRSTTVALLSYHRRTTIVPSTSTS